MTRQKDTRKILGGVHIPVAPRDEKGAPRLDANGKPLRAGTFLEFTAGQEDELEAHMTPEQHDRLQAKGVIAGDWQPGGGDPKAVKAVQEAKAAEAREAEERAAGGEKSKAHAAHDAGHKPADKK